MISLAQHLAPWHSLPIVVIDSETTGPDPDTCMPVELAVVRFEGGEPAQAVATALSKMKQAGQVENLARGTWRLCG